MMESYQVHLEGVTPNFCRPNQLLAIFSSYEKARAYIEQHTEDVFDGDYRKVGTRYTGVLTDWDHYYLREVPLDPE